MRVLFTLLTMFPNARAADGLHVRAHVDVRAGQPVRLEQLVEGAVGAEGSTVISKGVAAGRTETISSARLAQLFRPLVARGRGEGRELHLVLPKSTVLRGVAHDLDVANVARELIEGWRPQCGECRLEIENLNLPAVAGVRDWSIKTLPALPKGSFSVPIELHREGQAPFVAWVGGRLLVRREVPVARRLLQMGERVTAADYAWDFRDTAAAYDGIPDRAEVEGRKLRRGVANGDVLWAGTLERERAIHRGDLVQLRAGDKDWEVSLSVVAPQDAFVGDVVNFRNAKTNNVVIGRVTGPGQAEIQ